MTKTSIITKSASNLTISNIHASYPGYLKNIENEVMQPDAPFTTIGECAYYTALKEKADKSARTTAKTERIPMLKAIAKEADEFLEEIQAHTPQTVPELLEYVYFYRLGGGQLRKESKSKSTTMTIGQTIGIQALAAIAGIIKIAYKYYSDGEEPSGNKTVQVINSVLGLEEDSERISRKACKRIMASLFSRYKFDNKKLETTEKFSDIAVLECFAVEYLKNR